MTLITSLGRNLGRNPERRLRLIVVCPLIAISLLVLPNCSTWTMAQAINTWTSTGPEGGYIVTLAIDPKSPSTIYAGTAGGGIFKSTDGGNNWSQANSGLGAGLSGLWVNALAIDPINTSVLYAGFRDNGATPGIFKSTDAGGSWNRIVAGVPSFTSISALAIDPKNPSTIFAASDNDLNGVFKSTDSGGSWTQIKTGMTNPFIKALAIDPTNTTTVYAASSAGGDGIYKTTNGGDAWMKINTGLNGAGVNTLAIDPNNPSIIYAGTYGQGVFKTTNGGTSWSATNAAVGVVLALAIDPRNPTTIYAGTYFNSIWKSIDAGSSWSQIISGPATGLTSTFFLTLAIDPNTTSTLYAGSVSGGVYKSTNSGTNWTETNKGIIATHITSLAIDSNNPSIIYAASDGRIYKTTDRASSWSSSSNGISYDYSILAVAVDPKNSSVVYAGGVGYYKSTNGGNSWVRPIGGPPDQVQRLVIDPQNPAIVYAGLFSSGVFKSTDNGVTWSPANTGLPVSATSPKAINALAIDPHNTSILYAATNGAGGVYKSTNGGSSWTAVNTGLPTANTGQIDDYVASLAIDPSNSSIIYAGTVFFGIYKSVNGGNSWSAINNGLPSDVFKPYVSALAIDPNAPSTIYAGTDYSGTGAGVYKSTNGGNSWVQTNVGFVSIRVSSFIIDTSGGYLYAGMNGNGVYTALPPVPMLLTDETSGRAAALDSVTFVRDPFSVTTQYNFSSDQRTRIALFAVNVDLMPGENISVVTAQAQDAQNRIYPLTVEFVGKVPNFDWLTQVNIKLPDGLAGDVQVNISLHGVDSNKITIRIR